MNISLTAQIEPGDIKNLLTVCDGRKSAKHEIYGSLQIIFDEGLMHWLTSRDGRHMAHLALPVEAHPDTPNYPIPDGTSFLKALYSGRPFNLELGNHVAELHVHPDDDGEEPHAEHSTHIVETELDPQLSFWTMWKSLIRPRFSCPPRTVSTMAFEAADAKLFGAMVSSAGKPATVKLEFGPGVVTQFSIVDSQVQGYTCINSIHSEWSIHE